MGYELGLVKDGCIEDDHKFKIGLFRNESLNLLKESSNSKKILQKLSSLKEWFTDELVTKRHSSAHRVPLYVIPVLFSEKDAQQFNKLEREYLSLIRQGDLDQAFNASNKSYALGKFSHMFGHENNCLFPIYPTLIVDCSNVLSIVEIVIDFLASSSKI